MAGFFSRIMGWDAPDAMAVELADIFVKHVKPDAGGNQAAVDRAFFFVLAQATGEMRKGTWRAGGVARLCNSFGWNLVERGYPEAMSLSVARQLAIEMAKKKGTRAKAPAASGAAKTPKKR